MTLPVDSPKLSWLRFLFSLPLNLHVLYCGAEDVQKTGSRPDRAKGRDGDGRRLASERLRIPRFASVQYRIGAWLIASLRHKVCQCHYRDQYVSCWQKSGVKSRIIHPPACEWVLGRRWDRPESCPAYMSENSSVIHDVKDCQRNWMEMERLEAALPHLSSRYDHVRVTVHCRPTIYGCATSGVLTLFFGKVLVPD